MRGVVSDGDLSRSSHVLVDQTKRDGLEGAAGDALFAHQTALRVKVQLPRGTFELQCPTGADAGAEAAIHAALRIDVDLRGGAIETQSQPFQPSFRRIQLVDVTGELNHHRAALIGGHLGTQDLGGDIEVDRQSIGDRLMHRVTRNMQRESALHGKAQRSRPVWTVASIGLPECSAADHRIGHKAMNDTLGRRERALLGAIAAALLVALIWLRGGLHPEAPLEQLARRSLDLPVALSNGRPTIVEFYADWCEACRAMAPAMAQMERQRQNDLDVVLLNVDNPRWQGELERYAVNGIPQLELFDSSGANIGRAIGARSAGDLQALSEALVSGSALPQLAGVGALSQLDAESDLPAAANPATMATPRSHG